MLVVWLVVRLVRRSAPLFLSSMLCSFRWPSFFSFRLRAAAAERVTLGGVALSLAAFAVGVLPVFVERVAMACVKREEGTETTFRARGRCCNFEIESYLAFHERMEQVE